MANIWFNPHEMSIDMQKQYLKTIVNRANKRMQRLHNAGLYSYAYTRARRELEKKGRTRFSYRITEPGQILDEIFLVEAFLAHESSLTKQVKKMQYVAFQSLNSKLKFNGFPQIPQSQMQDLYQFFNSQQFRDMADEYGSDYVIEDISAALEDNKISLADVIKQYEDFMQEKLPLEALQQLRKGAIKNYGEYRKKRKQRRQPRYRR